VTCTDFTANISSLSFLNISPVQPGRFQQQVDDSNWPEPLFTDIGVWSMFQTSLLHHVNESTLVISQCPVSTHEWVSWSLTSLFSTNTAISETTPLTSIVTLGRRQVSNSRGSGNVGIPLSEIRLVLHVRINTTSHARLDNTQSKPNFSVWTPKPRYWIAVSGARQHRINGN